MTRAMVEIAIFSRAPVPGAAKRRLAPALGPEGAAALQARMTEHMVAAAVGAGVGDVTVWGAPDAGHPFFHRLAREHGVVLRGQVGRDLGARMHAALEWTLGRAQRAIIVGTDCPALGAPELRVAARRLEADDAVLGAACDGGYVLLGLKRAPRSLFRGVSWGTDAVLGQTRERLTALGWRWSELGPFPDIDRPPDLAHLPRGWV